MSDKHYTFGRFVWRELMTTDVEAAKGFYGELFGWSFKAMDMGGSTYWVVSAGTNAIGGIMKQPPGVAYPPAWMSYVSVDDVDATIEKAKAAGGQVPMGPMNAGDVGRFAVIVDPGGAATFAFKSNEGDPKIDRRPLPSEFCWESLSTHDADAAKTFYAKVYGWKAASFGADMSTFGVAEGMEGQVADIGPGMPGLPSFWMTHVVVESLAKSRERAKKLGGTIAMEEIPVPGIGKIGIVKDAQGATICLFEPAAEMKG